MVPSLSISSTLYFPECHPVADYVFFLVSLSLLSFLHYRVLEGSSDSRCDPVAYPGIFFERGGVQQIQLGREDRERGSGGGSPLVKGSGGNCNLVQEISFHVVIFFLNFWYFKTIYEDNQFICHCKCKIIANIGSLEFYCLFSEHLRVLAS